MKWLLQNVRRRAAFAIKNPRYAAGSLIRELTFADEKFIAGISGVSVKRIRTFMNEPISDPRFARMLHEAREKFAILSIESADLFAKKILAQYATVRAFAPDCIVETGVANGVSSSYLLFAIQKNRKGHLHSIGLADPAYLPPQAEPGWLVPSWLRDSWSIHLGDARDILPSLLTKLRSIDIFIHDSLHTYEHMMWEFKTSYGFLRPGGLLLSDDALWNDAFNDFARGVNVSNASILRGVGFLRKN